MAIFMLIRWPAANSVCSILFSRSVSPACHTLLIQLMLLRIHSGKNWWELVEIWGDPPGSHILDVGFFHGAWAVLHCRAFAGSWGLL